MVRRVYGGIEFPATNCAINYTYDHPCPLPLAGPSYMSGELNFCSVDLATYITSDDCPREQWTIPHEDVSMSNYFYSYENNTAYHHKIGVHVDDGYSYSYSDREQQHKIHVVSVNTSRILLLPNMKADWEIVNLRNHSDLLKTGEFLWGHSIMRGKFKMYLYWKKDSKFRAFWNFFYRVYTRPSGSRVGSYADKKVQTVHHGLGVALNNLRNRAKRFSYNPITKKYVPTKRKDPGPGRPSVVKSESSASSVAGRKPNPKTQGSGSGIAVHRSHSLGEGVVENRVKLRNNPPKQQQQQ